MMKILVLQDECFLNFTERIIPVFFNIKTVKKDQILKALTLEEVDAILFDYFNKDKRCLQIVSSLKKYRDYNTLPIISIVNKNIKKEEIRNVIFNGVDRIIYYPFKEITLIRKIQEVKKIYNDIFIEQQSNEFITFKIKDNISFLYKINNLISVLLYYYSLKPEDIYHLKFVLYEIGVNAIKYRGRCQNPITITVSLLEDKIIFKIKDLGKGFDTNIIKNFLDEKRIFQLKGIENAHGLGIFYSNKIMDRMIYNSKGNYVILEKFI